MIPITLNSAEYLLVEVPEYVSLVKTRLKISGLGYLCHFNDGPVLEIWHPIGDPPIRLPSGTWQIALRSWDMSEEEAEQHMERHPYKSHTYFINYAAPDKFALVHDTALQSAQSLFSHYGITYGVLVKLMK